MDSIMAYENKQEQKYNEITFLSYDIINSLQSIFVIILFIYFHILCKSEQ